jgi:hypothetical protein
MSTKQNHLTEYFLLYCPYPEWVLHSNHMKALETESKMVAVDTQEILGGKPRPHYLTGIAELSPDYRQIKAIANFPSTDPTIGDRGDHVNVSHHLFGIWNAAHILAGANGYDKTRTAKGDWHAWKETKPDEDVNLHVTLEKVIVQEERVIGKLRATYTNQEEALLAEYSCTFFAEKTLLPTSPEGV